MARGRVLKPEFFGDVKLSEVCRDARLLYAGLWGLMDRRGLMEYHPKLVKRELFPYDDDATTKVVDGWIGELVGIGRLRLIEHEGKQYLYAPYLPRHQHFHKDEKPNRLISDAVLERCQHDASTMQAPKRHDANTPDTDTDTDTDTETDPNPNPNTETDTDTERVPARRGRPPAGGPVWDAYSAAYSKRHGVEPPRNAKSNALCVQLVKRLGELEAPQVASFYLTHRGAYYAQRLHPLELLVKDAEKLRTEWATGQIATRDSAVRGELRAANVQVIQAYAKETGGNHG